jgi:hypothetical protein
MFLKIILDVDGTLCIRLLPEMPRALHEGMRPREMQGLAFEQHTPTRLSFIHFTRHNSAFVD